MLLFIINLCIMASVMLILHKCNNTFYNNDKSYATRCNYMTGDTSLSADMSTDVSSDILRRLLNVLQLPWLFSELNCELVVGNRVFPLS